MSEPSTITLPDELKPVDGRFGSGPSKIPPEAVHRLAATGTTLLGTSHRKPPVKQLVRRVREGLTELFSLPDGYEVALGNGGATLFWDAAVHCLIRRRSAHAVFGEFSSKFADVVAAASFLDPPLVSSAPYGERPELEETEVDAYALTHNETSTGVQMPVDRPGPGLVLVDATSAAGALAVEVSACDAYYFSPQKAFGSEGGLWLALLSPAAVERIEELTGGDRYVPQMLNLRVALENSRQNQTYNTPAVATLFLLAEQIEWLNAQGGLAWAADSCAQKAAHLYGWAETVPYAAPYVKDEAARSRVVCTIDLDESVPAAQLNAVLRDNDVVDTDAYRKLGRNQIRVAVFPGVDLGDVERLTAAVDHIVERLT